MPDEVSDDRDAAHERWWAELATASAQMDEAEVAAGRTTPLRRYLNLDGAPIFSLESAQVAIEGIERAAALGFTDVVVHWPRDEGIYAGPQRALEELAAALPGLQSL